MEGFDNKNYVVDKILGKGPDGNAYKVQRISDGVLCTIKELDVRHMTEEEKEDATEEIRVLATVHNENLISYYDVFAGDDRLFVVMEYSEDADIGSHIKTRAEQQKFFSEAQVWSYLIQMLRGLVALHSKGLIHRNVRSANIIQLDSNAVKLGDVAVGKLKEGPAATQIGDPHYIPPEVWENKAYTFKGDVWAVGCVLYEMAALTLPFGGCSLPDLRLKVIEGLYQPIPSSFSSGLRKVLKLLLNPDQATRISARDMLVHPILKEHLQYAPAPLLRVRASKKNVKLGPIAVNLSMPRQAKSAYPTLAVPADKLLLQSPVVDSKQAVTLPSENKHQSGLSKENPEASLGRLKVLPILAPRAILSSPDNDEMLSELNRPPNQASKIKVPRVAMLGKVIPKSPSEISVAPPTQVHLASQSPRVNLKHFKTAYIQAPKIVSDEFAPVHTPVIHDRPDIPKKEKLETPVSVQGLSKRKSVPAPTKVTPRREKSAESVRSLASSHSDDSLTRVRAPADGMDSSHTKASTPRRENSVESVRSLASTGQSEDSVILIRAPMDISDVPHPNVAAHNGNFLDSLQSSSSSQSDGSTISVPVTTSELDSAQQLLSTDYLPAVNSSLLGSVKAVVVGEEKPENHAFAQKSNTTSVASHLKVPTPGSLKSLGSDDEHHSQDPIVHVRVDGPEPAERPDTSTEAEPLTSDRLKGTELDSSAHTPMAPAAESFTSHTKLATLSNANHSLMSAPRDDLSRNQLINSVTRVQAPGDLSDTFQVPNSTRNRRLSFDGVISLDIVRKEKLEKHVDVSGPLKTNPPSSHSKVGTPRENPGMSPKLVSCDVATTRRVDDCVSQVQPEHGSTQQLQKPTGNRRLASEGMRREKVDTNGVSPGVSVTRPPTNHSKAAALKRESSSNSRKLEVISGVAPGKAPPGGRDRVKNTKASAGLQQSSFNSTRQEKSRNQRESPGAMKREALTKSNFVTPVANTSADVQKSVPLPATSSRKNSADLQKALPHSRVSKNQADNDISMRAGGADPAQSPHKPIQRRRLSLDFPIKAREAQSKGRSVVRTCGTTNGGAS